jgi:hypothetical protein
MVEPLIDSRRTPEGNARRGSNSLSFGLGRANWSGPLGPGGIGLAKRYDLPRNLNRIWVQRLY